FGVDHFHVVQLEKAGQREDVADVVVDDEDLLVVKHRIGVVDFFDSPSFELRHAARCAMQKERRFVEQSVERSPFLDDDGFGDASKQHQFLLGQFAARIDDDSKVVVPEFTRVFDEFESVHARKAKIENHAIDRCFLENL